jgi:hypothetical protein
MLFLIRTIRVIGGDSEADADVRSTWDSAIRAIDPQPEGLARDDGGSLKGAGR